MMAQLPFKQPLKHNVPGNLYVDASCIDCDVCRWMCPSVFGRRAMKAHVAHQPVNETEKLLAYSAMLACPVGKLWYIG